MAKKDKKTKKKDTPGGPAEAVRSAVERTFQATAEGAQTTRERARDLVDEVAGATQRVREVIDELRVLDDLKGLRSEVEALARRVAALELRGDGAGAAKPAATAKAATAPKPATTARRSTAASKSETTAPRSTAAKKPAARKTAAKPAGTAKKAGGTSGSRSTGGARRGSASS